MGSGPGTPLLAKLSFECKKTCDKKHYHRGFQGGNQGFFRGSIGTRQNHFAGSNREVVRVHFPAENASCGLLARGFCGAGRESRLGW